MGNKLIIIGILFALMGGIVLFLISPQVSEIRSLRSQYAARRAEFENVQEVSRKFNELRARYIAFREGGEAGKIDATLPRDGEIPELLVQLEAIAAQTTGGVLMRDVNFSLQLKPDGPSEIIISTQFAASYAGIKEYLRRLAKNRRLIDLRSLSFGVPIESGEESVYDFALQARTYFQP